ncbi:protein phosphatase 1 regulatory subunit 1C isoform X3 [Danio rerio]|uniref:Protein phosphatase 1 regulatory subunit 1C isoform X3 n=1 Tax=Danio rerio TaxID=7955 RepID=A0AC58GDV8_DANRE
MEPNSPKKIQFAVPLFQSQLDPQAAEHIRKRRPTPATLVIYNEPSASGDDKQSTGHQTEVSPVQMQKFNPSTLHDEIRSRLSRCAFPLSTLQAQNAQLSPAQRKQSVYTPPTMRGKEHYSDSQQEDRESHQPTRLSQKHLDTLSEEPGDLSPRRKDTPYLHQPPFIPGVKMLKNQTDPSSLLQEEEESSGELKNSQTE